MPIFRLQRLHLRFEHSFLICENLSLNANNCKISHNARIYVCVLARKKVAEKLAYVVHILYLCSINAYDVRTM